MRARFAWSELPDAQAAADVLNASTAALRAIVPAPAPTVAMPAPAAPPA